MPNITLYYANWCGHCTRFKPEWNRLKKIVKSNPQYASVQVEEYEQGQNPQIMQTAGIRGYPTIKVNGNEYNGERKAEALLEACVGQAGGAKNDAYYKQKYLKYKAKYFKLLSDME